MRGLRPAQAPAPDAAWLAGERAADFVRTSNRKDFSVPPLPGNLLARAAAARREIISIGKIGDIFAHRDTGLELKGKSNDENVDLALRALADTAEGGLIFVNLVDFDTEFAHRRDVPGYAHCLEAFVSLGDHPLADSIALGGLRLVAENLVRAVSTPNDLDARGAISVTERAAYIGRVRALARLVAQAYYEARERLGFPMLGSSERVA